MNWLRKLRKEAGLNQDELAARLQLSGFEITAGSVSHWETGRHKPPLHDGAFRQAISDALNVDQKTLLDLAGYEVNTGTHSVIAERVATIVDHLPLEKQTLALRLIEQIAQN